MTELAKWDGFYVIVGSAAGALIGLQFVVLTLIAERPPAGADQATPVFGSPTVVHFGVVLFLSALLHAPWQTITIAAVLWGLVGFGGVAYTLNLILRMREQTAYQPVFEDWLFHVVLPLVAYAALALSSFVACSHAHEALFGVGGGALVLLFVGIHNAYDNVAHIVMMNLPTANKERHEDESR
jgi:ABC-type transport system involved in multi-copper enzyme maturation permease subunit